MKETMDIAKLASKDIESYLRSLPVTVDVINVEDDKDFQTYDIDLIQQTPRGTILIEVKGDRYHRTGNYFFETTSNNNKDTTGCFLYTAADFVYYYFVEERELHILPMPATRKWFLANIHRFKERTTSTSVRGSSYHSTGRCVPRDMAKREVRNIKVIKVP